MNALFIYRYLTVGGVERVIRARLDGLGDQQIDAEAWFLRDGPGKILFKDLEPRIHVGSPDDCARYIEQQSHDVVTTIDTEEMFPAFMRIARCPPILAEVHTPNRENRVYLRWLKRTPLQGFVVPSAYQEDVVRRIAPRDFKIFVVPNPLQSTFVQEIVAFEPSPPHPVVAWVGRLDRLKNWRGFINLASRITMSSDQMIEFWLVGHGQIRDATHSLYIYARRKGVLPFLRWYRDFPPERMPRLYDAVRDSGGVVVSTSRVESFGMTLAEAMARGCPVVAPNGPPFTEFVLPSHGALYRPGSMRHAAKAIRGLLDDPECRQASGQAARQAILARHAPEKALPLLAEALAAAAAAGQGPAGTV
jgi:glycosyltransferase involved in cell wall biosynthesis